MPRIDPDRWPALLQQLGSPDFAQRQAAQKQLDQTTWRDLDLLQKSAAAATDPEIKARLDTRLAALNEELAANPPPLSVNLKDASLAEVGDALFKSLGMPLEFWPPASAPDGLGFDAGVASRDLTFTLTATDEPFWNIFLKLTAQHGLFFQDMGQRLLLSAGQVDARRRAVIVGPVAVFPQTITRQRIAFLQHDPGVEVGAESMQFSCEIAFDPRLRILSFAKPAFSHITDDAGNVLLHRPKFDETLQSHTGHTLVQFAYADLPIPEKKGARIASAKGRVRFVVQTAEDRLDIAESETKKGQSFTLGGTKISIVRFTGDKTASGSTIDFSLNPETPSPALIGLSNNAPTAVITDATGRIVLTAILRSSVAVTESGPYVRPFTLHLSVPTKTKEFTFPFELKDLPLP